MPACYGRLKMRTREIENSCICELEAMMDGYRQRQCDLEDILLACCTIPIYQAVYGRKAPTFKELTRRRDKRSSLAGLSREELLELAEEK